MDELSIKHNILIAMLDEVSGLFDNLNFDTFDSFFPEIVKIMKEVHELKAWMINEFGPDTLLIYESEAFSKAKQIEVKFDNIVRIFSEEESRLEKELQSFRSRKKLINYKRYEYANQRTF